MPETHAPPAIDASGSESSLQELWATVRRHRWMIVGIVGVVVTLAAIYTARTRPAYESVATLRITGADDKASALSRLAPLAGLGLPGLGGDDIDTEIGVLQSREIADAVAEQVGLHVELRSPRVPRSEVLRVVRAPQDRAVGEYRLRHRGDGSYAVSVEKSKTPVRVPERVAIGQPFQLGDVTLELLPSLRAAPPEEIALEIRPFRRTVAELRENLLVERQQGRSRLLEVGFRSTDPVLSAAVVNGVAESFVRYKATTSNTEAQSTVRVLREQIALYAEQLRQAEERLQSFQEQERIVAPDEEATQQVRRLGEIQVKRDQMQVERQSLGLLLERIRAQPRSPNGKSPYRQLATFPSFISNRAVQDVLETLTKLENERSTLLVRRTESDDEVRQLTGRIEELEQQLHTMAISYQQGLDGQIASAEAALDQFGGEMQAMPSRAIEYSRLVREQKLLTEVYLMLQTQLKEAEVRDAVDSGDVRILDAGLVADEPVSPKPLVNMILATILGLLVGLTTAFGRDMVNTKVRSRADVEQASAGAVLLGTIPRIHPAGPLANGDRLRRLVQVPGRRVVAPAEKVMQGRLVTQLEPHSAAAEAYRVLRTNLMFADPERRPKVFVISSALPGDGRSLTAANLAITFAQQGARVLLVDADLRRGVLHSVLQARREPGLAHVLLDRAVFAEAVQEVEVGALGNRLHFLSAGASPPNPADLLGMTRMRDLVAELRAAYDAVIFDAPPLSLVTDAAVLGTAADSVVLVARNGTTERAALDQSVKQLRGLRVPVAGVILNDVVMEQPAPYGSSALQSARPLE